MNEENVDSAHVSAQVKETFLSSCPIALVHETKQNF